MTDMSPELTEELAAVRAQMEVIAGNVDKHVDAQGHPDMVYLSERALTQINSMSKEAREILSEEIQERLGVSLEDMRAYEQYYSALSYAAYSPDSMAELVGVSEITLQMFSVYMEIGMLEMIKDFSVGKAFSFGVMLGMAVQRKVMLDGRT